MDRSAEECLEALEILVRVLLGSLAQTDPSQIAIAKAVMVKTIQDGDERQALGYALAMLPELPKPPFGIEWLRGWKWPSG